MDHSRKQKHEHQPPPQQQQDSDEYSKRDESAFECNICLETARDAVVSMCGHLFCWPCLYQWLYPTNCNSNSRSQKTCPVCKSAISYEKTIPIYGRTGDDGTRQDPRTKVPSRPRGQHTTVPNQPNQFPYANVWSMGGPGAQIGFGDGGFHMWFGITSLPQYALAFFQEIASNDGTNNSETLFKQIFFVFGVLCILLTLCYY